MPVRLLLIGLAGLGCLVLGGGCVSLPSPAQAPNVYQPPLPEGTRAEDCPVLEYRWQAPPEPGYRYVPRSGGFCLELPSEALRSLEVRCVEPIQGALVRPLGEWVPAEEARSREEFYQLCPPTAEGQVVLPGE